MRSIRCALGRHSGQKEGGLAFYQCSRCKRSLPQTDLRYTQAMDQVIFLENIGDQEGAIKVFEETTGQKIKRSSLEEDILATLDELAPTP